MITYYLLSLGVIPYFASRAFVPLFTSALLGRVGPELAPIADLAGIQLLGHLPGWATSNVALLLLGLCAFVEVVANKIPELRDLIHLSDAQIKGAAAALMGFAIVQGDPMELLAHVEQVGWTTRFASGQSLAYGWSFVIGAVVWFAAIMRGAIFEFLSEMDEDDDLGIQGFLSWVEDGLGIFGMLFVVLLPVLALVLAGGTLLALWLTRRYLEGREQKAKVSCPLCGTPNPACGIRCSSCGETRAEVHRVGLFGTIRSELTRDFFQHRFELLARKRCGSCGERLAERRIAQECQSCGGRPFATPEALEEYLSSLRATLPRTLAILLAISAVPLVGLVPGVIYYRLSLISSLRCYVPRSASFLARWLVRLLSLFLIVLQPVPLLGTLTLPVLCWLNFSIYQGLLRRQARGAFRPALEAS